MRSYRIYLVGQDGRLRLGETFQASADVEAVERARALLPANDAAELWEAGRLVGRLDRGGGFAPGAG